MRFPRPLRPAWALALLAAAPAAMPANAPVLPEVEQRIVDGINRLRRGAGLPAVVTNAHLAAAAQGFADFMARTDRYGHRADGRQAVQRTQERGYAHCMVAENIAYASNPAGFRAGELAGHLVQGWRDSPPHRDNLLNPDATETGVAVARSGKTGRYYAVQLFARPQSLRVRFEIANRGPATVHYTLEARAFELPPRMTRTHEQCTASALAVQLPDQSAPVRIDPGAGERWRIEQGAGGRWRIGKG